MHSRKSKLLYASLRTGFILYLILFSSFALFHAYAQDELIDSHGCQIGQWVQHAQGAFQFSVLLLILVWRLLCISWPLHSFLKFFVLNFSTARAPPEHLQISKVISTQ